MRFRNKWVKIGDFLIKASIILDVCPFYGIFLTIILKTLPNQIKLAMELSKMILSSKTLRNLNCDKILDIKVR